MSLAVGAAAGRVRSVGFPPTCLAVVSHFRGCKTSPREQTPSPASPPEGAEGCIRYMRAPPRLHHHIIQHSASCVWFGSIQSESDGESIFSLSGREGCCMRRGSGAVEGADCGQSRRRRRRRRGLAKKNPTNHVVNEALPIQRGDEQTEQDCGGQHDGFGNHSLSSCFVFYVKHPHTHVPAEETTCNKHTHRK